MVFVARPRALALLAYAIARTLNLRRATGGLARRCLTARDCETSEPSSVVRATWVDSLDSVNEEVLAGAMVAVPLRLQFVEHVRTR